MKTTIKLILGTLAIAGAALAFASPALAQRDPAYAAARAAGQVGEKIDGYLGVVGGGTPALQAVVNDINIKRRALYALCTGLERVSAALRGRRY